MAMIELEIDGQKVEVPAGSMLMDAAHKLGLYVPHFVITKSSPLRPIAVCALLKSRRHPSPYPLVQRPLPRV